MLTLETSAEKEKILLTGLMNGIAKGIFSPELVMPAVQLLVPNIQMPLMMGNKMMEGAMVQAAEQEGMAAQEEAMAQEQGMEQPMEEEQMMEQQQMQPM